MYEDPYSLLLKFVMNGCCSFKSPTVDAALLDSIVLAGDRRKLDGKGLDVNFVEIEQSLCFVLAMYRKLKDMASISDRYKKELDDSKQACSRLVAEQQVERMEVAGLRDQVQHLGDKVALLQPALDSTKLEVQQWVDECKWLRSITERAETAYNDLVDTMESGDMYVQLDDYLEALDKYDHLKMSIESGATTVSAADAGVDANRPSDLPSNQVVVPPVAPAVPSIVSEVIVDQATSSGVAEGIDLDPLNVDTLFV